jgi:hypothetical protein
MHSEGGNRITAKTSREDVKCWMYGQENGYGTLGSLRAYAAT